MANIALKYGRPASHEVTTDLGVTEFRDDKDRIGNSIYYSQLLDMPPDTAYDLEPTINTALFGTELSDNAARKIQASQQEVKTWEDTLIDGVRRMGVGMVKTLAGQGKMAAELFKEGEARKRRWVKRPMFVERFLPSVYKWANENADQLLEWSDMMLVGVQGYYEEHPEEAPQVQSGLGYVETLKAYVANPKFLVQGLLESAPLMMEGVLGTLVGGTPLAIAAMALPISGEVYADARKDGTEVLPAFAQATLSGIGEAIIEEWTLGRKLGLFKNARQIVSKGVPEVVWEATKTFFRGTAEEGSQEFNRNFWRWVFTDRSQAWSENVRSAMGAGGIMELAMAGGFSGFGYMVQKTGPTVSKEEQLIRLDKIEASVRAMPDEQARNEMVSVIDQTRADILADVYPETTEKPTGVAQKPPEEAVIPAQEPSKPAEPTVPTPQAAGPIGGETAAPSAPAAKKGMGGEIIDKAIRDDLIERYVEVEDYRENIRSKLVPELVEITGLNPNDITDLSPKAVGELIDIETLPENQQETIRNLVTDYADATERMQKLQTERKRIDAPLREFEEQPAPTMPEELETREEAKVAEAKLEVEAAEIVKPKLYIGNVTPGMKARIADAMDWTTKDIEGFKEKGWPTNRTEIEMTKGEAEEYLNWLETDLLRRLDENKIKTRNDMAWANADWGDIKALRKTLGLETVPRPFFIVPGTEYEVRTIENVRERMYEAIHTTDESKMTVGEVLSAVLKRGARFAKMAYAGGRKELRADIRAKARAKARMKKAVGAIKRRVPKTVDILYREAIEAIKNTIDPSFRSKTTLRKRESQRDFLARNPSKTADMPTRLVEQLSKKPLNDYTIEELEAIARSIDNLKKLGKLRRTLEVSQYEKGKKRDISRIKAESVKIDDRTLIRPEEIGDKLNYEDRAKNALSQSLNWAAAKGRAVTPMDVFFDLLDGTKDYKGANFEIFKKTIDRGWSRYLDLLDDTAADVIHLADELGLDDGNFERIGVHGAREQENGNQKLLDTGYAQEQIDQVQLTPEEMELYETIRDGIDSLTEDIEDVMHNVYNLPLERVRAYMPFLTDFEAMSDYETREMFTDQLIEYPQGLRKNVQRKFTIARTGGKQKIKINAMEVFLQHIDNAAYLIEMGADIKRLGEIAATEEYRQAVGDIGQEEVRSWIDLMARKGRAQGNKTIPILDVWRKHIGAATIGFKLSSALVNATPLLDGAAMIGHYAFEGAFDIATNRQWREFLSVNFPEIRDRLGGDIELLDFGASTLEKVEKAGFWALTKIDGLTAGSITIGAYKKYLAEHGLEIDFGTPNQDAIDYAQLILRRTQSSAFFKDLPPAFTRGTITGNKSIDRLLLQFQSFMLNRSSLIRHDFLRNGIKTKNYAQMANMFFWLAMAGFAEMGLRRLSKEIVAMFTGEDTEDWSETFVEEVVVNGLQNVPFISQGVGAIQYGSMPVPTIAVAQQIIDKLNTLKKTKDPDKKILHALEFMVLTTGTGLGLPGTIQVSQILAQMRKTQKKKPTSAFYF
jgi:hypothetical protein